MTTRCFVLLFLSTYVVVKAAILTSDLGGTNTSVTVCPDWPITLTCQTSASSLVWFYPTGLQSKIFDNASTVNQTIQQDGFEFKLTHKNGNNFISTAVVKTADGLNIICSPDGIANNPENSAISILVTEIPPPPNNITVIDVQTDKILLHWDAVATADYYQVAISPIISGGSCDGSMCFFNVNSAVLDHLRITTYTIDISSVNCNRSGNHTRVIQDTIPKAIVTSDPVDEQSVILVCPDDAVTITCETKGSLVWLIGGILSRYYDQNSTSGRIHTKNGFDFRLVKQDGYNFTSIARTNTSADSNITCGPSGVVGDTDNSHLRIQVVDVLPPPDNLKISEVCINHTRLQWTSHPSADGYKINVNPKPKSGICINGSCILERQCTTNKTCVLNETSIILDGLELQEYSFDVSTLNCAGIGNPTTISETITTEVPPEPEILPLTVDESDNDSVVFHMTWKPPVLNCRTPKIDNYTVTITRNRNSSHRIVFDSKFCCDYDFQLERCGTYYFQLEASNAAGTSSSSNSEPGSSEGLYLTVSIVELKFDSITIRVEVNECFIPAIINVTIVVLGKTLERPEIYIITDQELVQIIKNLESDTMYNVTVTVFYIENGKELQLTPETLSFTTPQDFSAFERIVIIVLSVGGFLGLAVMFLILLVGIFCLRNEQRKRELRKVKKRQSKIIATQKEIQENLKEYERNTAIQHNPPNIEVQAMQAPYKKLYPQLLTHDSTYM